MNNASILLPILAAVLGSDAHSSSRQDGLLRQLTKNPEFSEKYSMRQRISIDPSPFSQADCVEFYARRDKAYVGVLCHFPSTRYLAQIGIEAEGQAHTGDTLSKYTVTSPWAAFSMSPVITKLGHGFASGIDCDNSDASVPRPTDRCYVVVVIQNDGQFVYAYFIEGRNRSATAVVGKREVLNIVDAVR